MCGFKKKIDLLFWNMNTYETRKVTYEKVQVRATVRDRNLWTPQRTMCKKEIYNILKQEFARFYKTGVDINYILIRCVMVYLQR